MMLSKTEVRSSYESSAWYYDLALRLYGLIGIGAAYRSRAVDLLRLERGDTVVELAGRGSTSPSSRSESVPRGG